METKKSSINQLFKTVVDGDYCIGCGACAAIAPERIHIQLDDYGKYRARLSEAGSAVSSDSDLDIRKVCPFSDQSKNEDEIARDQFGDTLPHHDSIGYYHSTYAGYVKAEAFRQKGGSGGFGKWILTELLRRDMVDAVIQVTACPSDSKILYEFAVFDNPSEVIQGSKSVYYPVEMSKVLAEVKKHKRRYAIVGVPCFIKAVRLLQQTDAEFKARIQYCIGLVCGHLKSTRYAESLALQMGVEPKQLASIDFRWKFPDKPADVKGTKVRAKDGTEETKLTKELLGGNYNEGFFRYKACEFCDDVVAETADISIGDAWLPEYIKDSQGTSVVVVRSTAIHELLIESVKEERIALEVVSPENIAESQAGGLRDRREGLAYRMQLANENGVWSPPKRISPKKKHLSRKRRAIYKMRVELSATSHKQFLACRQSKDFETYKRSMANLLKPYNKCVKSESRSRKLQRSIISLRVYCGRILRKISSFVSFL